MPVTGMKPELKPFVTEPVWQGVVKPPCTTEWLWPKKWNSTMSPTAATVLFGENVNKLFSPTLTFQVAALAPDRSNAVETRAESPSESCILNDVFWSE